jgi:chemotaxis signal transduction protein
VNRDTTGRTSTRDEGILRCFVGAEQYAFRTRDVRHVARAEQLRDSADADGRVGLLKLGGQHVPVFSLGRVLGRPGITDQARNADHHIAVTGDRDELVGWLVDRVARTATPERGGVAPIPRSIGSPASRWFEAVVTFDADDSALLIAPQYLNPLAARPADRDDTPAFGGGPATAEARPEPVAVLFSTDSLPPSAARRYALSGRQIAAIVSPTAPILVPGCADHVRGVTIWRQSVVPVIEFRSEGTTPPAANRRRLIAQGGTRSHGSLVGLTIDAEIVMHRPAADHRALADVDCPAFCSGMFDINGEVVGLLDLDRLLTGAA